MVNWILGFLAFTVMVALALVVVRALQLRGFDPVGALAGVISPTAPPADTGAAAA